MLFDFYSIINTLETEEQRVTAEYICEKFDKLMYFISLKILRNEPDAEDAVIQTVIYICENINDFMNKQDADIKRMVGRYTRNVAINIYNKNKRIQEHKEILNENEGGDNTLDQVDFEFFTKTEHYGILQHYVMELDDLIKQLLLYRYVEGMTCEEISKKVEMPASTVSTKINRALKKVKQRYIQEHEKEGAGK